jgi:uncharacterized repeat protein (TIGR03803 family)
MANSRIQTLQHQRRGLRTFLAVSLPVLLFAAMLPSSAMAGSDGANPQAALTSGQYNQFFGTTYAGGAAGLGTVFEMKPGTGGAWSEQVLYSFAGGDDGANPSASLVQASNQVLYGTTYQGGTSNLGTVFQLVPSLGGAWTEKVLYSFAGGADGANPQGGLVIGASYAIYGTTYQGGAANMGTIFELLPGAGGVWNERVLYSFGGGSDGAYPQGPLVLSSTRVLYGTTSQGGDSNNGTVYQLVPIGGAYAEKVLYSFGAAPDGASPLGGVVIGANNVLYGTTNQGGANGHGAVFELLPGTGVVWNERLLYSFGGGTDGSNPQGGVSIGTNNVLYGTTFNGGSKSHGAVFELIPSVGGTWSEKVLYSFASGTDGANPAAGLALGGGKQTTLLYGTTYQGGSTDAGTVFRLKAAGGGRWGETVLYVFKD